ncbi:hypothetical protein SCH4B_1355 [Ruegeria sp. TrichCH4B]|nr:hypothetical protein SCH4B_1355 [Ruegeria sp. TrichCH4B]
MITGKNDAFAGSHDAVIPFPGPDHWAGGGGSEGVRPAHSGFCLDRKDPA